MFPYRHLKNLGLCIRHLLAHSIGSGQLGNVCKVQRSTDSRVNVTCSFHLFSAVMMRKLMILMVLKGALCNF